MGKVLLTLLGFIALGCACRPAGAAAPQQMLLLPDGVVLYGGARALVTKGKVIGFAFAPTNLIACCLQEGDRGGVFLISRDSRSRYTVWQAPPGVSVSGPLRWSPDGHRSRVQSRIICGRRTASGSPVCSGGAPGLRWGSSRRPGGT